MNAHRKYIPSLNGLRAISIIFVLISHALAQNYVAPGGILYHILDYFNGRLGVIIFFVISGYLITSLLLDEENEHGAISIKNFYLRRVFRIMPVYYTLLLVYFLLQIAGVFHLSLFSWLSSLTFTKQFNWQHDWESSHLWSISIEENFYLIWPVVFKYCKKYRNKFVFLIIFLIPVFRFIAHDYHVRQLDVLSIFQRGDSIMWGCFFAICAQKISKMADKIINLNKISFFVPFILLIFLDTVDINELLALPAITEMDIKYHLHLWIIRVLNLSFGGNLGTIADISIGAIIILSIRFTKNFWFRFLNSKLMNYIGKLSYSLYIWQMLFLAYPKGLPHFINILLVVAAAIFSYHCIEKPFLKLKDRFN